MKFASKIFLLFVFGLVLNHNAIAQKQNDFLLNLCQRWEISEVEIISTKKKYPPDKSIAKNYLQFNQDGYFRSMEAGVMINGKWNADELKMELVIDNFENQNLASPVIFKIITLTKTQLAITSVPPAEIPVIMHYRNKKLLK